MKAAGTNVDVTWFSQDTAAGLSTDYDLIGGLLSELSVDGGLDRVGCLQSGHPDSPYTDARGNPPSGDGHYYLIRARNRCATGTYGSTGSTHIEMSVRHSKPMALGALVEEIRALVGCPCEISMKQ